MEIEVPAAWSGRVCEWILIESTWLSLMHLLGARQDCTTLQNGTFSCATGDCTSVV
jgi:hypothetical protein